MGRILAIGSDDAGWQDWIDAHLPDRTVVVIDPADATRQPAGRCIAYQGDRPIETSFVGSLNPQSAPHALVSACARMTRDPDCVVLTFAPKPAPLLRQTLRMIDEIVAPDRILIPTRVSIPETGWTAGPERIELPASLPKIVRDAQRKAQWLRMIERELPHEIPLADLTIHGARLGSGVRIPAESWILAGLPEVDWAEVCGSTLFVVSDEGIPDAEVTQALDFAHCDRMVLASPADYHDRLCALCRDSGEEFGYGRIERIDFKNGVVYAKADAIPPVPVRIVKLGALRVDGSGVELGESKPWAI